MIAAIVVASGLLVIGYLWWTKHPQMIDRGDGPGNKRTFWNLHSKLHIVGAAITALPVGLFDGFMTGFLVAFGLWFLVELAQRFPRDQLGGVIEWADVVWNAAGALGGAGTGWFVAWLL